MLLKALKSMFARIRSTVVGAATSTVAAVRAASNVVRQRTTTFYRAAVLALFMFGTATAIHAANATSWVAHNTRRVSARIERSMNLAAQKLTEARAPYLKPKMTPVPVRFEILDPTVANAFRNAPVNFVILVDGAVENLYRQVTGKRPIKLIQGS